jgi:hypothetical protein
MMDCADSTAARVTCSENEGVIFQSSSAIEKLPLDALMEIMALLFPKDIIRMRLVS